jgi:sulfane dehydrogenase subunit SoxC
VDVSTDGGATWHPAELQDPVLSKAHTRFSHMWRWNGSESLLLSRAVDETGYVQPTRTVLLAARGIGTDYHFNCIRGWRVAADGRVFFHGET